MEFSSSRAVATRFEYLDEASSTNDVLVAHATGEDAALWPDLSVVVTDNQTRGRGRLGRTWMAPSGKSLAVSVLIRPALPGGAGLPPDRLGWFPLLAGAAMTGAVARAVENAAQRSTKLPDTDKPRHEVTLKWPNDVLINGYKVSGILSELLPGADGVVIGAGVNLSLDEHDLPTLTSTSLLLSTGVAPDADDLLSSYLTGLSALYRAFLEAGGDPVASGLLADVTALCGTLRAPVRVELPNGSDLVGTAVALDPEGRLVVRDQTDGELRAVAAGDVTHLRY